MADYFELKARTFRHGWDTAAPTTGQWIAGEVVWNSTPSASAGPLGWICVTGGTPGTWIAFYPVKDLTSVAAPTAAANVAIGSSIVNIGTGGFNLTLAAPTAATPGNVISLVNPNASPCTLVAGTGTSIVGNVTLAANASCTVQSAGTFWYRI